MYSYVVFRNVIADLRKILISYFFSVYFHRSRIIVDDDYMPYVQYSYTCGCFILSMK